MQCTDENVLPIWYAELIDLTLLTATWRTRLAVAKNSLAEKEICWLQNTNLTAFTRWHTDTGLKFSLTVMGWSNVWV